MVKTLVKSIREYKKQTLLTPILMFFEVGKEIAIPFLLSILIDKGITNHDLKTIIIVGLCLVIASFLSLLFGRLGGKIAATAASGFAKNLRQDMYNKVQEFSFTNIDKFSTSSIVTRLTSDVANVQMAFMMCIRAAIRSPITIIFALIMTFILSPKIGIIYLVIAPLLFISLLLIIRFVHPIFKKVFKTIDKLNRVVQENVNAIRVVKSFVTEKKEIRKFEEVSESIYQDFSKAEKIMAFNNPIMQITIYTCLTLISWFGAHFVVGGELTTGQLTSLFTYVMQLLMSLMMLSIVFVMIIISLESGQRIAELIEEEPDLKNPENPIMKVEDGSIDFKNVSFSYVGNKDKEVLKNITFKINSGETVGIIGGTGDGKSSLVNLIPRLYDATEGEVLVGGKNVKDYNIQVLRDQVSMVLQKNTLFSGTIKDNLRWGKKDATDEEMVKVCKLAQADEFIEKFPNKYDTYIEQGGNNLSGGQKQRLCIARALLKKPQILILDDSTSAVDTKTDSLIRKAFAEEIPNTTKIIIAQRISSVQDSDKIIILDNGIINAIGTHEELLESNEIYKDIYYSQMKGSDENA